jgi:hypothetical protein
LAQLEFKVSQEQLAVEAEVLAQLEFKVSQEQLAVEAEVLAQLEFKVLLARLLLLVEQDGRLREMAQLQFTRFLVHCLICQQLILLQLMV